MFYSNKIKMNCKFYLNESKENNNNKFKIEIK